MLEFQEGDKEEVHGSSQCCLHDVYLTERAEALSIPASCLLSLENFSFIKVCSTIKLSDAEVFLLLERWTLTLIICP